MDIILLLILTYLSLCIHSHNIVVPKPAVLKNLFLKPQSYVTLKCHGVYVEVAGVCGRVVAVLSHTNTIAIELGRVACLPAIDN